MALLARERSLPESASAPAEICVETITDYSGLLALEPDWNALAKAACLDHPFLEHSWVRTWWECFGAGSTLRILVLRANDELVAIAPLILTPVRLWGIKVRRLGFFYNAHVPRADFLVAQRPEDAYKVIWEHLRRNEDWDLLQLCQLKEGSATLDAIRSLAVQDRCQVVTWISGASPFLPLHGSWADYHGGLSRKHRSNLRNRLNRLNGIGHVGVETTSASAEVTSALEAGLQLEAAAWKGENRTAISSDPAVRRFYSTLAGLAAERGWLRLNFLLAGSQRIAFDYSLAYGNRIHLLKVGYDPAYASYSPSNLLLCQELCGLFERDDVREYNFLGETADWKAQWTKHAANNYWLFIFPPTFKGRVLYFIKSRLVPFLKRKSLQPLRTIVASLAALTLPRRP